MVPGQRRRFRKGWSERFDPRRHRRVFLNGTTYPGEQPKLLGSHGGKSYSKDWDELRKKKIIEHILEKEAKEMSLLDYRLDEFDDDSDYDWWYEDEEDEELIDFSVYGYDDFNYNSLDDSDSY